MDRRFAIAIALSALVFFLTPMLFPSAPPVAPKPATTGDSARAGVSAPMQPTAAAPRPVIQAPPVAAGSETVTGARAETIVVTTPRADFRFSSVGAAPIGVVMKTYRNLAHPGMPVSLETPGAPLLGYSLITGGDTTDLRQIGFSVRQSVRGSTKIIEYAAIVGDARIRIRYAIPPDTGSSYRVEVAGEARGIPAPAYLVVTLPTTLPAVESDTADDRRQLAYVFKPSRTGTKTLAFRSLAPGETQLVAGPHSWAAAKTKYFVVAILAPRSGEQFTEGSATGVPRMGRDVTRASAAVIQQLQDGAFSFELYTGPQEWKRLLAMGRGFDEVNPYGWRFLQGIVQPFAVVVMRILLWMHNALKINYGWVLVIFGIAVRVVLWPLNQAAMRSSMKMQQLQPKLVAVQKRYAADRVKQQQEMMRVYKEANASPFTALSGCLPMLLPMPFLVALFFIFQNTIEFRGVPFMWLHDLSVKDPYYVLPVVMGVSMYGITWLSMRNAPPNPQAKMMGYVFPVMMTYFLLNLASGLNLYYAVQNLATLPQQWLLARSRARAAAS